jgi:hypothetical protein
MTAEASERAAKRRRWEKATNWPLMVGAVIFLAAYALPLVVAAPLPQVPSVVGKSEASAIRSLGRRGRNL